MRSIGGESSFPTGSVNQLSVLAGRLQDMRNGAASQRKDSQASSPHTHFFLFKLKQPRSMLEKM